MIGAYVTSRQRADRVGLVLYAFYMLPLCGFVGFCDDAAAATLSPAFNAVMVGIAALPSFACFGRGRRAWGLAGLTAFTAGLLVLSRVDYSVAKSLQRLCDAVRPGMTRAEVDRLAARHFPPGGRFGPLRVDVQQWGEKPGDREAINYWRTGGGATFDMDRVTCEMRRDGRVLQCSVED